MPAVASVRGADRPRPGRRRPGRPGRPGRPRRAGAGAARRRPAGGAFVHVDPDAARAEARSRRGGVGPLQGVPVGVKDLYDVAGQATRAGSEVPAGPPAAADSAAVARLRAAGAVVLGRTRTHEFAWGITTQHPRRGGTRNPHDLDRVPGGSSGGSAAAVAAGVVPLALGTDTGCLDPAARRLVRAGRPQADPRQRPARRRRAARAVARHRRRAGARRRRRPARARGAVRGARCPPPAPVRGPAARRRAPAGAGPVADRARGGRGPARPPPAWCVTVDDVALRAPTSWRSTPPCRAPRPWPGTARPGGGPRTRRRTATTSARCSSAARPQPSRSWPRRGAAAGAARTRSRALFARGRRAAGCRSPSAARRRPAGPDRAADGSRAPCATRCCRGRCRRTWPGCPRAPCPAGADATGCRSGCRSSGRPARTPGCSTSRPRSSR